MKCYVCDSTKAEEMEKGPPLCKVHRKQCAPSKLTLAEYSQLEMFSLNEMQGSPPKPPVLGPEPTTDPIIDASWVVRDD